MKRVSTLVVIALTFSSLVVAQPTGRETELEAIRDEIARLQVRLNQVRRQSAGLKGELEQTGVAIELQAKKVDEAQTARTVAEESLVGLQRQVAELEVRLEALRHNLKERLADLYRLGRQGYLRLFLSIRSQEDLLPGIRQVRFLAIRDRELLDHYIDTRARLEYERRELEERQREVEQWLLAEGQRLDQLNRLRRRQTLLLAKLEKEQESLATQTARLEDKERKLASLLDFLYGRSTEPLSGTPIQNFLGVLDWPVEGTVVTAFGPRLDPRYKTQTPHNGLELATGVGSPVRAIYPGEVLFAAPFQGYGWTAVMHHSGRVFTLYAGLQDLEVARGDVLSLGHVIGRSADSLYFEIRVENRPVDPAEWLR
jgi:septal ring factor EnvC (AmiA/AmiB activator)